MKLRIITISLLALLAVATAARAQTTQVTRAAPAAEGQLDFGVEGLTFPPSQILNGHTPRTAQLLGEAYRRKDPLVWKRVQHVAELGLVGLAEGAPYVADAMKDPSPQVRAEAARSAAKVGDAKLLAELTRLLSDEDAAVRREAVLSAAALARKGNATTDAVVVGLADKDASVVAAALQSAWTPAHAKAIAPLIATSPDSLKAEAALALGRLKVAEHASAVVPLLKGDIVQRAAAVRALGEMSAASALPSLEPMLSDPHPTVRREAIRAIGPNEALAVRMLSDADLTVRQAAANVLTPMPSTQSLAALSLQLDVDYAPLHQAVRAALIKPADATVRQATIELAGKMLASPNPRRREDASFVLGHLRSDHQLERHIALLQFDPKDAGKSDWALIAQAAESLGLIGRAEAAENLMKIVTPAPEGLSAVKGEALNDAARASGNAMIALSRLRHQPALAQAIRILDLDPGSGAPKLRAGSAFAIGMLAKPGGNAKEARNLLAIYDSIYEDGFAKLEALKALGNLRHAPAAPALKKIAEGESNIDMRWIAHWAYQRAANTTIPYTSPTERREPPVSITDLTQK